MTTFQLPQAVQVYEQKLRDLAQTKKEISQLKPLVTAWLETLPRKTFQMGDGKLKVAEIKIRQNVNESHIETCLFLFLTKTQNLSEDAAKRFAAQAAGFIIDSRAVRTSMRLQRTHSQAKKNVPTTTDKLMTA